MASASGADKDKGKTCVYKKENDKKVGCTDGPVKDYLAALHIHANESIDKANKITKIELKEIILQEAEIYKKEYEKFPTKPYATLEYKLADKYGNFTGNKRINIVENSLLHKENISFANNKKYFVIL